MRVHLFLMTAYAITAIDARSTTPTPSKAEHFISPVLYEGDDTALPPEDHKNTSETNGNHTALSPEVLKNTLETHGNHTALPSKSLKNTSETHGSLSKPTIQYNLLDGNAMYITCFSKSGPLPIRYQLFLSNRMLEEKVAYRSEPVHFNVTMTPLSGPQVYFNCTAISPTGEKSSNNLTIPVVMDDSAVGAEDVETEQKDKETGPEHLIPLQHILTSVTPEVLQWNTLVLITCGPIILSLLAIVIIITYIRSQNG